MKRKSSRMERICLLAKSDELKEKQKLGRAQNLLDAEKRRLDELQTYRQTYERKSLSDEQTRPAHWADYQAFLGRLSVAIREQQNHVASGEQNRDMHRKQWIQKRQRLQSLQKVAEQYRKDESYDRDRKWQRSIDELAKTKNVYST